jgi:tetratricopeptide (TPR) repeat protein
MDSSSNKSRVFWIYAALVLATIIAFEPMRHNGFVDLDDRVYVIENPKVNGGITWKSVCWAFTAVYSANWHPLTWLSHMLDCELFGPNPLWHHSTSLLFHVVNTLLLFCILKRMTGFVWRSAFVAAAFALHPLHVESVAWVSERKDVLSGFFWMLTILFYVRYARSPTVSKFLPVFLFLGLGLMAKPMLVTLPFVLLLLDYWPLDRFQKKEQTTVEDLQQSGSAEVNYQKSSSWSLFGEKIPLFILAAASCVITFIAQQSAGAMEQENLHLSLRTANALVSYVRYINKLLYPGHLAAFYPFMELPIWQLLASNIVLFCISLFVIYASRRRYLAVGWLWYLGTLVPVIGLVQVGLQGMADRYTYLPSIGIFIMVAWGIPELLAKLRHKNIVLGILSGLILVALSICTRTQVKHWQDTFTLFDHTLAVTGDNFVVHRHYGNALARRGQLDKALVHFNEALRINPQCLDARNDIGMVFLAQGRVDKAIECFNDVLRLRPDYPNAHINLGLALAAQAEYDKAIEHLSRALQVKSDWPEVYYYLGLVYQRQGKYKLAIQNYTETLRLKPECLDTMNNLAWLLATVEDRRFRTPAEAVKHAERACKLSAYKQPRLLDTLAVAYAAANRFNEAIETAEKAIHLAESAGQNELTVEIQSRLQLYKAGQTYQGSLPAQNKIAP